MANHLHPKNDNYQKVVPFIIFILALVLLFNLIRPMIAILLGSVLLAYLTFPIYRRLSKKISHKFISITLSLLIIFIIILIPFSLLAFEATKQGLSFYDSLSNKIVKGEVFGFGCTSADSNVCAVLNKIETFSAERLSTFGFDKQLQKLLPILEEKLTKIILTIPLMIAKVFLTFFLAYYVLKDWENILKQIVYIIPLNTKTTNRLVKDFKNTAHDVIYAQLFAAIAQGVMGAIGFWIFGVPLPILLGLLLALCSLIPIVGTAIIWFPVSLFLVLNGYVSNNPWIMIKGAGLFLYGLLIISTIDNILLAKIVHEKAKISQILVIIGVIGGAIMFGIVGVFIGPILLPLLITYFETFREKSNRV